uniref:Retrovirus-related Pol polyprotein from transposon TNT 1-94 n=1 Tax=Cajanus cajan TaxID=3821 RepID=A0A151SWP8_CAJCA|nr:Retrovirus-related Pol polyprotein from transposon TNT 1-94 [Cajanus cajan]KYP75177.1 Retrovirus-related Pol polyprotein from transposon TNT 1-94 [Cajanus cajan]
MLTYKRSNHLEVIDYLDSNYAGCVDSRKSSFEYIFLLAGRVMSWKNAKQSMIATFTMKVEFVACFDATIQALWSRNFTLGFGILIV